jgi:hypothetical protein
MAEMTALRRRMTEDMKVRNLSPATQRSYVHAVAKFAQHFKRPPDRLGLAEIRAYQNPPHLDRCLLGRVQRRGLRPALFLRRYPRGAPRWSIAFATRASGKNCR